MSLEKPVILNIAKGEFVTVYSISNISDDGHLILDYRYTGSLPHDEVNSLLRAKINSLFEEVLEDQ